MRRISVVLALMVSVHAFIWWRLVSGQPWVVPGTIAVALGCPSLVVSRFYARRLTRKQARPIFLTIYTWFGLAVYLLLAAVASFFVDARWAALGAVAVVALGIVNARHLVVKRVSVPLLDRPYRIAQLTDVHIGVTLGRAFAEKVAAKVNALAPDLIVLTGDIVDWRLEELREHAAPLGDLRAPDGVFMVTGNHEYYWNAEAWLAHLASLGLRPLRNAHVPMRGFDLAGVDDSTVGEDVDEAIAGATQPIVLLAHHPSTIARSAGKVALQLSGHTHGGQLLPLGWLSKLFEPHVAGLARFASTYLYVSEGTGFWGPPLRVGTSCEIALIDLGPGA